MMLSSRQQRADRRQNARIARQTNRIAAQDRRIELAAIDAQNNLAAAMQQDGQSLPTEFIDETGKKRRGMGGMQSPYGFAPMGGSGSGLGGSRTTLG